MLEGIKIKPLTRKVDERGCFTELIRNNWGDLLLTDKIEQVNYSVGHPGVVRAWHRHVRGTVTCVVRWITSLFLKDL
jgi:dTDP-4-dehydrorhamnose 3,5-epimerase